MPTVTEIIFAASAGNDQGMPRYAYGSGQWINPNIASEGATRVRISVAGWIPAAPYSGIDVYVSIDGGHYMCGIVGIGEGQYAPIPHPLVIAIPAGQGDLRGLRLQGAATDGTLYLLLEAE